MAISQEYIQELKQRTNIVDVVSDYVTLKRAGRNMVGLCPFHSEKTPSFNVSGENEFFHCFGCGAGGDVITFIRRIENLDYVDAVKLLAQRAGMQMPEDSKNSGLSGLKNRIYEANREAARFFHRVLYSPDGKEGLEYLRKRGLSEKTIIHFGLGFSPQSRFELTNHLKGKGFTNNELLQAGLVKNSKNGYPFDMFSDRVMFPIIDLRGNVIGFGGRIMSDIKPKYLNTPETPVFNKRKNLFALRFAKNKANGQLILVEGYMDVIALHQAGIENAVATLGTALTEEQALAIKRYCKEVVICYDSDSAGQTATARAIDILRTTGIEIKVLTIPDGKDPDEFIKKHGDQGSARFRMLLEKSGNDIEYKLQKLRSSYDLGDTPQRVQFMTEAVRLLSELDNSIERDIYLANLSRELGVDKSALTDQAKKYISKNRREAQKKQQRDVVMSMTGRKNKTNTEKVYNLRASNAEEAIIAALLYDPDTADYVFKNLPPDRFVTGFNRRVYGSLKKRFENNEDFTITDISGDYSAEEISYITDMLVAHPRDPDPLGAVKTYIGVLSEESERLTPEELAKADNDTIMEHFRRLKDKKK